MAATSDTLRIIVMLRDNASRGIKTLSTSIGGIGNRVKATTKHFTGLQAAIAGLVTTATAGLLARSFLKAADAAEGYRVRLSVLLGSQKEANALFKEMADFASGVSFQYEEIMESATALSGVMEGGREEIGKWMPLLADLTAASGLTMQEATSNFIKMYSAGAAAADMFRERGILAMLGFQAKVSYTAEQTRKMLIAAWEDPASKFRDASLKLANTWSGLVSMMQDRWFQFRLTVMDAGVLNYLKAFVKYYLDWMAKLKKEGRLDEWARNLAMRIITTFEQVVLAAASAFDALRPIMHGIKVVVGSVLDVWRAMPPWMQEMGVIVSILLGKKFTLALAATIHLGHALYNIARALGLIAGGALDFKEFADMNFEQLSDFLEKYDREVKGVIDEVGDTTEDSAAAHADSLRKKVEEFLGRIHKIKEKLDAEAKKEAEKEGVPRTRKPRVDVALVSAGIEADARKALEINKTLMAELEAKWAEHQIKWREYFEERFTLINNEYEIRKRALERLQDLEQDPKKKAAIEAELAALEQDNKRKLIALQLQLNAAVRDEVAARKEAADIIDRINQRIEGRRASTGSLADRFAAEQADLRRQQQADIDALLELQRQGYDMEEQLQDAHHRHMIEQEQLLMDQRKRMLEEYLNSIGQTMGMMADAFWEWYEKSARTNKRAFKLWKAAAIAETIVQTFSAAQKAFSAMAGIPIVGPALGAAAAGVAIAQGMMRVNAIRNTQFGDTEAARPFAEGGEIEKKKRPVRRAHEGRVPGVSPTPKADNILIRATAGEYMHPVRTVRHYGLRVMEAIRRMEVPREVLERYASGFIPVRFPALTHMAVGGPVVAAATTAAAGATTNMNISVPVMLPEQLGFIGRRLEAEIEPVVVRVMREELRY